MRARLENSAWLPLRDGGEMNGSDYEYLGSKVVTCRLCGNEVDWVFHFHRDCMGSVLSERNERNERMRECS